MEGRCAALLAEVGVRARRKQRLHCGQQTRAGCQRQGRLACTPAGNLSGL